MPKEAAKDDVRAALKLILVTRVSWHQATTPRQLYMSNERSRQRQWDSRQTHAPRDCFTGRCCKRERNKEEALKAMRP